MAFLPGEHVGKVGCEQKGEQAGSDIADTIPNCLPCKFFERCQIISVMPLASKVNSQQQKSE